QHGQNPIQIELDNVAANINPNGYTALRLGISGGQPTGLNQVRIAAYAAPLPLLPPRLIIEYAPPTGTLTGTVTDASGDADYAASVLADAPVGYWRFGETSGTTATDMIGNNHGAYHGGATLG